jgi:hypothetical protein
MQTLQAGRDGLAPESRERVTLSSCPLSTGQPQISKSTRTCSEIGVEVESEAMNSGLG